MTNQTAPLPRIPPSPAVLAAASELGIEFEPGDLDRLEAYLARLLDANRRMNLTAITDPDEAWIRHILDSLTLLPLLASIDASTIIDVGSGGGCPGLPLALVMPQARFTLLEATAKKARFLAETAAAIGAANVSVVCERAETAGQDRERHRERYDAVVARAVGRLPVLLELTIPLARIGGIVLAIKGEQSGAEIDEARAALHVLHAKVIDRRRTPTGTIVVIEKTRTTPKLYPRRPGEPKRSPIANR